MIRLLGPVLLAMVSAASGQVFTDVKVSAEGGIFRRDGAARFTVKIAVPPDQYAYKSALDVSAASPEAGEVTRVDWPEPKKKKDPAFDETVEVYEGDILLPCEAQLAENPAGDAAELPVTVSFQTCGETICYPPTSVDVQVALQRSEEGFELEEEKVPPPEAVEASPSEAPQGRLQTSLSDRGIFLTVLLVYLLGVAASFTPCVFPLIPVLLTLIGAGKDVSGKKGLSLSFLFVLGLATTYTVLGVVAAKTGGLFGQLLLLEPVQLGFALLFFLLALSMFGAFELQMPAFIRNKASGMRGSGALGAYLTGIAFGVAGSACLSPLLAGILGLIAQMGRVILGASLLFFFALGLGTLFLVIGLSFGTLASLKKGGIWLEEVKKLFGFLLLGTALFYLKGPVPPEMFPLILGSVLVIAGVFVGHWGVPLEGLPPWYSRFRQGVGLVAIVAGSSFLLAGLQGRSLMLPQELPGEGGLSGEALDWSEGLEEALERGAAQERPVLLFFSSPNCLACVELKHKTLADPEVVQELDRFLLVYVMLDGGPRARKWTDTYEILGTPTVRFVNSSGQLLDSPRIQGFVGPEVFLPALEKVQ